MKKKTPKKTEPSLDLSPCCFSQLAATLIAGRFYGLSIEESLLADIIYEKGGNPDIVQLNKYLLMRMNKWKKDTSWLSYFGEYALPLVRPYRVECWDKELLKDEKQSKRKNRKKG